MSSRFSSCASTVVYSADSASFGRHEGCPRGGDDPTRTTNREGRRGLAAGAGARARERGNPVVNDAHLFYALLSQDDGIVVPLLQKAGLNATQLKADTE